MQFWSLLLAGAAVVAAAPQRRVLPRDANATATNAFRAAAIQEAYLHSWNGYSTYAFGHDELLSVSNAPSDSRNGWGASIADGLSTAILMGLGDVVKNQSAFLNQVDFTKPHTSDAVSLFETTIRYLGGLVSGYELLKGPYADLATGIDVDGLLKQAEVLANGLSFAFDTPSGVPFNDLNYTTQSSTDTTNGIATIGTLVLEWTRLSDLTGNQTYAALSQKGESFLLNPQPALGQPFPGLLGTDVNVSNGQFVDSDGGWSGGDDSFYEYLIKAYVYDPVRFASYKDRWVTAVDSTISIMLSSPSSRPNTTFVDEWINSNTVSATMGHLTCFIGGNFLLGAEVLGVSKYFDAGLKLTSGCHDTYTATATRIGPERFAWLGATGTDLTFFNEHGFYITAADYDLRPEVIESYYYAYRLTGDTKYQDWAWDAFLAINATCRTDSGFTEINDVNTVGGGSKGDFQESFWFAEVLKYLYLIFDTGSPVAVEKGAQKWVFNTEAHPFKVYSS